ncbi:MAG: hypothetical protein GX571_11265 [Lentisphaerae bacterium]|nr:hypothetical protein [Lentisphaerota bacterium]
MTDNTTKPTSAPAGGREPDELLAEVRRSILGFALLLSAAIHLVLIGGTSFGLYRDWGKYGLSSPEMGFHTPSKMNLIKNRLQREADDAARKLAAEERAAAAAAAATNAPAATATAAAATATNTATPAGTIKPPEVEPLPPKSDFSFGEDLKLD